MSKLIWDVHNFVYRDCKIKMSEKSMSNLLYAVIMTHSKIQDTYGVGIYDYNRKQNTYNTVDIKIHIHPNNIEEFEQLSGFKLKEPIKIMSNQN